MSTPYKILNALPPEAFLNPDTFRTGYDDMRENANKKVSQYEKGLLISRTYERVGINAGGTWFAEERIAPVLNARGALLTSYEGIGYHSCTADLLRGFLDGPAEIVVIRNSEVNGHKGYSQTVIRPAKVAV